MLRIFIFNDKNQLNLLIILTIQFFGGSKWSGSNPISYKTIWNTPNIENNENKLKNVMFFQTPFYF